MSWTGRPKVAREGRPYILVTALLAVLVIVMFGYLVSLPVWLLVLLLCFLFRDPDRHVPASPLAVVSPIDGQVMAIEKKHDPFLDREAQCLRLKISSAGSYGIRSPTEGKLINQWSYPVGSDEMPADNHRPKTIYPEQHFAMWLQTDEEDDVTVVLRLSGLWQRPSCYISSGERIGQGQRCGMLLFGGEVDLYLPANARLEIHDGDQLLAGSTIVGSYLH